MSEFRSFNDILADYFAKQFPHLYDPEALGRDADADQGHLVPPLLVEQMTATMIVSNEMLMDCGVIPDTRPPLVLTRRERFARWRRATIGDARMSLACRAYRFLSGEDVS